MEKKLTVKEMVCGGMFTALVAAVSGNVRGKEGLIPQDAAYVKEVSGICQPLNTMVPYVYEEAVSPHLAARKEGNPVELSVVCEGYEKLKREYDMVVMEGSGGILCPLRLDETRELWLEDVIQMMQLPCLVVADSGLGTINATVLTLEYLKSRGIEARGVILNHFHPENEMEQDNRQQIEHRGKVPVIACVPPKARELEIAESELWLSA